MLNLTARPGENIFITWGQGEDEIILGSFNCDIEGDRVSVFFNFNKEINILREKILIRSGWPANDSRPRKI